jgi:ribosomal protein L20
MLSRALTVSYQGRKAGKTTVRKGLTIQRSNASNRPLYDTLSASVDSGQP